MAATAETVESALRRARGLARGGAPAEAAGLYLDLLARYPGNRKARRGLAEVTRIGDPALRRQIGAGIEAVRQMLRAGRTAEAVEAAGAMLAGAAQFPVLHTLLAEALVAAGDPGRACAHLMTAHRLAPEDGDAAMNLARMLMDLGRPAEVAALTCDLLAQRPGDLLALALRGNALAMLGQGAEARDCLDRALAADPENAALRADRSGLLFALGETALAEADIRRALALDPDRPRFLYLACVELALPADDPLLGRAAARLADPALPRRDEALLAFGLARQHHLRGERAAAFALWSRGNAARKAEMGYALAQDEAEFARMRQIAAQGFPQIDPPPLASRRPVFVTGLPRSGTTLAEQILASHPQVHGAGERDSLAAAIHMEGPPEAPPSAAQLLRLRAAYLDTLAASTPEAGWVVDKMPSNFLYIPWIAAAFPEAAIIHLERDPVATCWSNFRNIFPQGGRGTGFGNDLADLAGYHRLYRGLMADWTRLCPGRILPLGYEALCADQRGETERLLARLGLPWHEGCMQFHETARTVTTTSAAQVRRPLYQGSSESWRAYEAWLGPLLDGLADARRPAAARAGGTAAPAARAPARP
ncbi:tetratricopeptide repeat-containing sulfotransferase family protein [Poseidonocella sp. HB161398]|uniref:tetratricopeptide repeat-containing sulfotransferase family protein n=1 Tax=Poseidonocella sp. HB161398 TaxID=2320855 RepID=UPI001109C4E9|nr:tetratricopeptide repeat-containing sulfotransferase family protein [Poseidonocella sp. HB161398]